MSDSFYIIGGDGKEYGPVPAAELAQWIADRRADANTRTRRENESDWQPLAQVPELAGFLPSPAPAGRRVPGGPPPADLPTEAELLARDYDLRILDFLGDGWQLLTRQFGPLVGAAAIMTGFFLLLGILGVIPFAAMLTTPASILLSGPLMGGLWHVCVRAWRGNSVQAGEIFDGFRLEFASLLLVNLLITIFVTVSIVPGAIPLGIGVVHMAQAQEATGLGLTLLALGLAAMVAASLLVWALWAYAFELVMDRRMGFWAAMELSRKVVARHPFKNVLFFAASGLLSMLGILLCGVGIFFTMPWVYAAYARAYDELFGPRPRPVA